MGLRDITSTVFTRYKTDTADHERGVKRISDAEQKRNVALAKQLKQQEAGTSRLIGTIGKLAVAVGAVGLAAAGATKAMKVWQEDTRMRAAAAGISIDGLRKATEGLITKQELLGIAAANQNSDFKVTQQELENVTRLMIDLNRQGNDMAQVQKEVTKALAEGTIEGLKKFGVNVHGIKPGLEAHNKLLELAAKSTGGLSHAGEGATKANVSLKDAMHDLNVAIGEVANSGLPMLINGLAKVIEGFSQIVNFGENLHRARNEGWYFEVETRERQNQSRREQLARRTGSTDAQLNALSLGFTRADLTDNPLLADAFAAGVSTPEELNAFLREAEDRAKPVRIPGPRKPKAVAQARTLDFDPFGLLGQVLPNDFQIGEAAGAFADLPGVQQERFNQGVIDLGKTLLGKAGEVLGKGEVAGANVVDALNKGREAMFQQKEIEFLQNYGRALGIVEGAAQSMFTAMVTGSKGAGEALREFLGQALLGEGTRLIGVAVTEGVLALAALASGNFVGAGAHGKAAAAAAAGAVTLGTLASAMGAGGSMPGASAAGRGIGAGVGAAGGRTVSNTYIIGGDMLSGSARQNAANMRRALERADREDNGNRDAVGVYG